MTNKELVKGLIYNHDGSFRSPNVYDDLPNSMLWIIDALDQDRENKEFVKDCLKWMSEAQTLLFMVR